MGDADDIDPELMANLLYRHAYSSARAIMDRGPSM
jgi:hypothetical protein